jgi:hypothetical protein
LPFWPEKKHHKIDQKNIGESEERLGERLFVCLFVRWWLLLAAE